MEYEIEKVKKDRLLHVERNQKMNILNAVEFCHFVKWLTAVYHRFCVFSWQLSIIYLIL